MIKTRYNKFFTEKTINELHHDIDLIYNKYKNKFTKLSELVWYISDTLHVPQTTVLQILDLIEKKESGRKIL